MGAGLPPRPSIGLALPQAARLQMPALYGLAALADRSPIEALWTVDSPGLIDDVVDPVPLLAAAAAATTRVRLGTAVMLPALYQPLQFLRIAKTLHTVTAGRALLGIGLGGALPAAYAVDRREQLSRFGQSVAILAAARRRAEARIPPLWFGARSHKAMERAVVHGDGWIGSGSSSLEEFRGQYATVQSLLASRGRDPNRFGVAKRLYILVETQRDLGREMIAEYFQARYGSAATGSRVATAGTAEECAAAAALLFQSGARHVILHPATDDPDRYVQIVEEVVPVIEAELRPS